MVTKGCVWILLKGERVGQKCGKPLPKEMKTEYEGYCYTHLHKMEEADEWAAKERAREKNSIMRKLEADDKTILKEHFAFTGPASTGVLLLEGILRDVLPKLQKGFEVDFALQVLVMKR